MRQDLTNLMDDVLPELLGLQTQKSSVNEWVVFFFYVFWWFLSIVMASGNWRMRLEMTWASMIIMLRFPDDDERNRLWFLIFLQLIRRAQGSSFPPVPPGWLIVLFKVPLRSHLAASNSNMFQYLNHPWTTSIDPNFLHENRRYQHVYIWCPWRSAYVLTIFNILTCSRYLKCQLRLCGSSEDQDWNAGNWNWNRVDLKQTVFGVELRCWETESHMPFEVPQCHCLKGILETDIETDNSYP